MHSLQWYDWFRIATVCLSLAAASRLLYRASRFWALYTSYLRELVWILAGSLGFIALNAIERLSENNDIGIGVFVSFALSAYAFTTTIMDEIYIDGDVLNEKLEKEIDTEKDKS